MQSVSANTGDGNPLKYFVMLNFLICCTALVKISNIVFAKIAKKVEFELFQMAEINLQMLPALSSCW